MLSKGGAAHARGAAAGGARQRSRREVGWSGVSPPRAVSRSTVIHATRHTYGRNERCLCACGAGHARGRGAQTQTPHLPPLRPLNATDLAQNGQPAQASHTAHGKAPDRTRSIEMARRRAHTTGCRRRTHDISTRIPRSRPAVPGRRSRGRATVRTCALHPHPAAQSRSRRFALVSCTRCQFHYRH